MKTLFTFILFSFCYGYGVTPPWLDAPAGVHGFVGVSPDSRRLVFADGKPARFYGVCLLTYLNKSDALVPAEDMGRMLDDLKAMGVNLIRFQNLPRETQKDSFPDGLNQIATENRDRFIAEGKKRGIYFHMNLFTAHPGDLYTGILRESGSLGQGMIFFDRLSEMQKTGARLHLSHVNPHTGLAYKDEPAIISIELGNELHAYSRPEWREWDKMKGSGRDEMNRKWNAFLKAKYGTQSALASAWGTLLQENENLETGTIAISNPRYPTWKDNAPSNPRESDAIFFGDFHEKKYLETFRKLIRDEIGDTRHLISDNGWIRGDDLICRTAHEGLDLLDLQNYYPHGPRGRKPGDASLRVSPLADTGLTMIGQFLSAREYQGAKKPFMVTEYNSHIDSPFAWEIFPVHTLLLALSGGDGEAVWIYYENPSELSKPHFSLSTSDSNGFVNPAPAATNHWFGFNRALSPLRERLIPFLVGGRMFHKNLPEYFTSKIFESLQKKSAAGKSAKAGTSLDINAESGIEEAKSEAIVAGNCKILLRQGSFTIDEPDWKVFVGSGSCQFGGITFTPAGKERYLLAIFAEDGLPFNKSSDLRFFNIVPGVLDIKNPRLLTGKFSHLDRFGRILAETKASAQVNLDWEKGLSGRAETRLRIE